ncbi:C-type lectin domain family 5 member A-like isoform X2 [Tiliqua scincoides]|uniref:C-type lectin domain family 5 member A-like isoform X2 n=1 Tax=Tiliqua scincoides TaxID=71010 RepID=UPI0034629C8D
MNWSLVIPLLAILSFKLIGTTLFLQYASQIFYTSPLQEAPKEGAKGCPIAWAHFEGKCYFFSAQEKSWHNSRNDCTQSNADLAIVNSNEELTFLKTRTENADYFVGLTKTSGMWKWIDNTDLDQNIFSITNRDNDCAVVGLSTTGTVPCSVPTRWICEKNA